MQHLILASLNSTFKWSIIRSFATSSSTPISSNAVCLIKVTKNRGLTTKFPLVFITFFKFEQIWSTPVTQRRGSGTAATSKMVRFVIIVSGWRLFNSNFNTDYISYWLWSYFILLNLISQSLKFFYTQGRFFRKTYNLPSPPLFRKKNESWWNGGMIQLAFTYSKLTMEIL